MRREEIEQQQPRTLIIALTAHALEENAARCIAAGMDDIMTKPIDYGTLHAHIKRIAARIDSAASLLTVPDTEVLSVSRNV